MGDVTRILSDIESGDSTAAEQLLPLIESDLVVNNSPDQLLALDEALCKLAKEDPPAAEIAQLRTFGGLTVEESGKVMGVPRATAYRHWTYARAWLQDQIREHAPQ
jgi:DNA-directed RNA polymerase specialized sigma24 family protein